MNTVCWAHRKYLVNISATVATGNWAPVYPLSPSAILSPHTVWSSHAETPQASGRTTVCLNVSLPLPGMPPLTFIA